VQVDSNLSGLSGRSCRSSPRLTLFRSSERMRSGTRCVPSNLKHSVRGPARLRLASEGQKGPEAEGERSMEANTCRAVHEAERLF
uniref:Uncharacterized protein n=1 Tax=Anas zonorhyncha TaxID=75864 RepID=A0A8B9U9J6_9AVES